MLTPSRRRRWRVLASFLAFALLGVACGRVEQERDARGWGERACGALLDWQDALEQAADQASASTDVANLQDAVLDASAATRAMTERVDAAGPFPGRAGDDVDETIDAFVQRATAQLDAIDRDAGAVDASSGPVVIGATAVALGLRIHTLAFDVRLTVLELDNLPIEGNLRQAVRDAPACRTLRERR